MILLSRVSIELRSKKQDARYRIPLYAVALSLILNYPPRPKSSSTYIEAFSVFQVHVSGELDLEPLLIFGLYGKSVAVPPIRCPSKSQSQKSMSYY